MLLKPRLNKSGCVYRKTVNLEKVIIIRNNIWIIGCTWLTKIYHLIAGSNSTIPSNYGTSRIPRYCCPYHYRSISMFHLWNQAFRIIGYLGHTPNIKPGRCWEQREG